MSDSMTMAVDVCLVIALTITIILLWKERAHDERERMHRMLADRIGFLVGAGSLVVVIVIQSIRHESEELLSLVLLFMLLAKIAGHFWSRRHR